MKTSSIIIFTSHSQHCCSSHMRKRAHCAGIGLCISMAMIPTFIVVGLMVRDIFLPRPCQAPSSHLSDSVLPGQRNLNVETVFIATSLHADEDDTTLGPWIQALLDLVGILGPRSVFLSIYEDGPAPSLDNALQDFSVSTKCNTSIISGHSSNKILRTEAQADGKCLKRISHLAEVHNRALQPLRDPHSPAFSVRFHKILFIDDIAFDPIDAANLLSSTNQEYQNEPTPREASCATDFINPLTFSLGLVTEGAKSHTGTMPHFPWYSTDRSGQGGDHVLDPRDVARAKACWGGLVVLEGRWFQPDGMDKSMAVADLVVHHRNIAGGSVETSATAVVKTGKSATSFATETKPVLPTIGQSLSVHTYTD